MTGAMKSRITNDLLELLEQIVKDGLEEEKDRVDNAQRTFVPSEKHFEALRFFCDCKVFFYECGFEFDVLDKLVEVDFLRRVTHCYESGLRITFMGMLAVNNHDLRVRLTNLGEKL